MADWLDSDDFPSGAGGGGVEPNSTWVHPKTGVVYFYNHTKLSWMTLGSSGARMYTDTIDPSIGGVELMDGDMWWDSRALELRVYHKPIKLNSSDPNVQGRWVSSTNPEMTLEDVNRNMIIGQIVIDGNSKPYEEEESVFEVTRPYGGAPESKLEYQWKCSPQSIDITDPNTGDQITHTVVFGDDKAAVTTVRFPEGMAVFDGGVQVSYNISCTISAKEEFEDEFVKAKQNSPTIRVFPIPLVAPPSESVNVQLSIDGSGDQFLEITSLSMNVSGPEWNIDTDDAKPTMFVLPSNTLGDRNNFDLLFSLKPPSTTPNPNDILSVYVTGYEPVAGVAGQVTGYLLNISMINPTVDNVVYMWNALDNSIRGTFTLKS